MDHIFLMTGVFTKTCVQDSPAGDTRTRVWNQLIKDLLVAESGVDPVSGKELAGGYFLVVWVLKADMEFFCNHYQLPGHWGSLHP
eukprot:15436415-Alexandrium_andersonii.AAC.1